MTRRHARHLVALEGGKGGMQPTGVSPVPPGEGSHHIPPYCHCGEPADLELADWPLCINCFAINLEAARSDPCP